MAVLTASGMAWLTKRLKDSAGAETKLFYLRRFPSLGGDEDTGTEVDVDVDMNPMGLACGREWTLSGLLAAARLIACDERALWTCLGPRFCAAFASPLDSWTEQLAVKLAHYFIEEQRNEGAGEREGEVDGLAAALAAYAAAAIKPAGQDCVAGAAAAAAVTLARAGGCVSRCGQAAVAPMSAADPHSEGSLVCAAPVAAFGELLRVPRREMFFRDSVLEHCALGRAVAADPALASILENEEALLVLCFVYEFFIVGPEASHWAGLLRSCPPAYPTVPLFWPFGDLAELAGTDVLDEVVARRTQAAVFCEEAATSLDLIYFFIADSSDGGGAALGGLDAFRAVFTLDNICFAKTTFDSRAFNLHVDGRDVLSLVPWADMINHQNSTDVLIRRVGPSGGDFVMQVGAALEAAGDVGRELWMSYGPLQNWELLQYYGFVLPDNEHDQLPFPFAPGGEEGEGPEGEWVVRRAALVGQYSLAGIDRWWVARDGVPCAALRALVRVHVAAADEFPAMEAGSPFGALSAETEAQVVAAIAATAECVLGLFPSSLDEDLEELALLDQEVAGSEEEAEKKDEDGDEEPDEHANTNMRLCLRVRIGIKQIAQRLMDWAEAEEQAIMEERDERAGGINRYSPIKR